MPDPFDLTAGDGKKILLIGESGRGKTGALAALIAVGYKVFMIDTDKGSDILDGLLRDDHFPYRAYMAQHNITPFYSCIPFDIPMGLIEVKIAGKTELTIGPKSGSAFNDVFRQLNDWRTPDGETFGNCSTWKSDCIIVVDTISTLGQMAKTYSQFLNNHPGLLADEYGRDAGAARDLISRVITVLVSSTVKCNVIINAHVTRVDTSAGLAESPAQRLQERKKNDRDAIPNSMESKGYPDVITRDFSTKVGKFFNNLFAACDSYGKREISTVPVDNIATKSAVWLERSYPIETGLLEILCALRFQDLPPDFETLRSTGSAAPVSVAAPAFGSFGR